jgi:preprotein translocase subunit SecD
VRRRPWWSLAVIVVIAAGALAWTLAVGNKPFLGLDLQGGVSVVLTPTGQTDSDTLKQARAIIDQRVNALGIAEPEITTQGNNLIVQIPGVKDKDRALELVGQTAELQFRPVLAAQQVGAQVQSETPTPEDTLPVTPSPSNPDSSGSSLPPDSSVPSTDAPPSSEQGLGALTEGEQAAGRQTPDTVTDSTAPPDPAATASTDSTAPTDTSVPAEAAPEDTTTIPADICETGVPADQNLPDQTVTLPQCDRQTNELVAIYSLGPVMLTGDSLETARAALPSGEWVVNPVFRGGADGIDKFNLAAQACNARTPQCPTGQLAIVLDGRVISAPGIQQPTFERDQIQISGSFSERSARDLATVLKYGALPVELEQQQAQIVSATLGRDALHAGLWAGLVGFILVTIYMVAWYRFLGALAIGKLLIEMALLWAIVSWLGATQGLALTLAGVTGLIMSIGVSLDSNVVYYEHLKEDIRNGRSIRSAADKAFGASFRTILAADLASLIGAGLLWWLTIGPVRGFALFLGLSGILDLIAAYYFMRPAVRLALHTDAATRHPRWFALPEERIEEGPGASSPREAVGVGP